MEVPLKSLFLFILLIMILSLLIYRVNYMEKEIVKENNKEKKNIFHLFIMKNAIIAGSIAYIIGLKTRDVMTLLLDTIINPLFSVDFDGDGIPDLKELTKLLNFTILGITFKFGQFILDFVKYIIFIVFIYLIVLVLVKKTNFVEILN